MYCGNCGKKVMEGTIACTSCGFPPRIKKNFCFGCGIGVQPEQVICSKCGFILEEIREDEDLEREAEKKRDEQLANLARRNIPASEWFALTILSVLALMLASGTIIGGLIFGGVIWKGYSYSFQKQKELLLNEMSDPEVER